MTLLKKTGFSIVSFRLLILSVLFSSQLFAADDNSELQRAADRLLIQEVAYRYIHALDTRDGDLYVSVFTGDAVYDIEGQIVHGHEELRAIITGLQNSRDTRIEQGLAPIDLYHTNINPMISFISDNEATYTAYWQTLRLAEDNTMRIGGMGRIEDELVKTDGEWKIKKRVLTNFVPR